MSDLNPGTPSGCQRIAELVWENGHIFGVRKHHTDLCRAYKVESAALGIHCSCQGEELWLGALVKEHHTCQKEQIPSPSSSLLVSSGVSSWQNLIGSQLAKEEIICRVSVGGVVRTWKGGFGADRK